MPNRDRKRSPRSRQTTQTRRLARSLKYQTHTLDVAGLEAEVVR